MLPASCPALLQEYTFIYVLFVGRGGEYLYSLPQKISTHCLLKEKKHTSLLPAPPSHVICVIMLLENSLVCLCT